MSDYDPNKPSTFITYLDKINLYGWAMSEYLPYGEFDWLKNVDEWDMSINKKNDVGYILKVYLKHPVLNYILNYILKKYLKLSINSRKTCCY